MVLLYKSNGILMLFKEKVYSLTTMNVGFVGIQGLSMLIGLYCKY